jgi:predicted aminopeptidase
MDSRSQYIGDVRETLSQWEDRAKKLNGDRAADLRATIKDARAELRSLQGAPNTDWQSYRSRVNSRLDHIQELYNQAKAE